MSQSHLLTFCILVLFLIHFSADQLKPIEDYDNFQSVDPSFIYFTHNYFKIFRNWRSCFNYFLSSVSCYVGIFTGKTVACFAWPQLFCLCFRKLQITRKDVLKIPAVIKNTSRLLWFTVTLLFELLCFIKSSIFDLT